MQFGFSISLTFYGRSIFPIDDSHLNKIGYSSCCFYASDLFSALFHKGIELYMLLSELSGTKSHLLSLFLNLTQLLQTT